MAGDSRATTSRLTGLPQVSTPDDSGHVPWNACKTLLAIRASTRLGRPGTRFSSWTSSGMPRRRTARPPGPAAYPPKLIAQRGRLRPTTRIACHTARASLNGATSQRAALLPRSPAMSTVSSGIPCAGTRWHSMAPVAPSHRTGSSIDLSASATARPGKICPPVPPAMIRTPCASLRGIRRSPGR